MTRAINVGTGVLVAVIGALALVKATDLTFHGPNGEPGPGFFPAYLAGILLVLGALLAIGALVRPRKRQGEEISFSRPTLIRAGGVWLALAFSVALMTILGFLASSIVLVTILVLGMEQMRGIRIIAAMLALPIGTYLLFSVLLNVRLPAGIFGS